jgi:hypothetical protein
MLFAYVLLMLRVQITSSKLPRKLLLRMWTTPFAVAKKRSFNGY